jgi:prophage tail gpP-like protein
MFQTQAKAKANDCENMTMALKELGLDYLIRYVRLDGSLCFSAMDGVMAVTGKDNNQAGKT